MTILFIFCFWIFVVVAVHNFFDICSDPKSFKFLQVFIILWKLNYCTLESFLSSGSEVVLLIHMLLSSSSILVDSSLLPFWLSSSLLYTSDSDSSDWESTKVTEDSSSSSISKEFFPVRQTRNLLNLKIEMKGLKIDECDLSNLVQYNWFDKYYMVSNQNSPKVNANNFFVS